MALFGFFCIIAVIMGINFVLTPDEWEKQEDD